MITLRRQLLGLGVVAASSLLALHAAQAMSGPTAIQIDGGPVGALQLSGGVDGYGYYVSSLPSGTLDNGAHVGSALVELQKTDGVVQFTLEVGSSGGSIPLGAGKPGNTSISTFSTGPLYAGYVTIAPTNAPVTISAGQIGSLEGYESGIDWNNASQLTTAIWYVQNSQARGVEGTLTEGPVSATVEFGDGVDSGVFNTVQALVSYTVNSSQTLDVYGMANVGKTGPYTFAYGGGQTGLGSSYANSDMIGAFYVYSAGSLSLVPEVQYQYAKQDVSIGIMGPASNLGLALFGDYSFGTSPYSVGGWLEYYTSHTSAAADTNWFLGPNASAIGAAVSPTWQYKDLFARANAGYLYLLDHTDPFGVKYDIPGTTSRGEFIGTLEAGLLF